MSKPSTSLKRCLSGIQPTADSFHLGNQLGALNNWVELQDDYDCFYFIADQHAITVEYEPSVLRTRTRTSYAQLLALGVTPERSTIFVQSQVPEHSQLAWVLSCLTGYGEASRMTQFKDKSAKGGAGSASVGLFTYPILQAADILLYQPEFVPVGEDQRQHLELTRDLAGRFNGRFGEVFGLPQPLIVKATAKIRDLQDPTKKMSKSLPTGCLFLLDEPKKIEKKIKSAVTDSETEVRFDEDAKPGVSNLLSILSAYSGESIPDLEARYEGQMYGPFKQEVADVVVEFAVGFQERTNELLADTAALDQQIASGAAKARLVAQQTLDAVYEKSGFLR